MKHARWRERSLWLSRGVVVAAALVALTGVVFSDGGGGGPAWTASEVPTPGPSAPTIQELTFWSDALGKEMPFTVYLPQGYGSSPDGRYPVLYMLHGLGGDQGQWARQGLFTAASDLIQRDEIPPLIIVTPEGERGYWVDHANSGPRYGAYVTQDLVSTIDSRYRTMPSRDARAIGGLSMGGHGALQLALNNPNEFSVIGAHSVALRRQSQAFDFFGDKQYFETHDPVSLCKKDHALTRRFKIWLDIGDADPWYRAAEAFHQQLDSQGIPHTWNVYEGGHNDAYWQAHVVDYLRFYGQALESTLAPAEGYVGQ